MLHKTPPALILEQTASGIYTIDAAAIKARVTLPGPQNAAVSGSVHTLNALIESMGPRPQCWEPIPQIRREGKKYVLITGIIIHPLYNNGRIKKWVPITTTGDTLQEAARLALQAVMDPLTYIQNPRTYSRNPATDLTDPDHSQFMIFRVAPPNRIILTNHPVLDPLDGNSRTFQVQPNPRIDPNFPISQEAKDFQAKRTPAFKLGKPNEETLKNDHVFTAADLAFQANRTAAFKIGQPNEEPLRKDYTEGMRAVRDRMNLTQG
jgi:hypothetical protein